MVFILDLICGNCFTSRLFYSYHAILACFFSNSKKSGFYFLFLYELYDGGLVCP
ncbi:hypothetical protein HMPREF3191_00702 [Veillonellaceae bacterium DNF00626]|nr:hypothetical protein HMPREF3191_00702 [Veillonellaceae bacterium DNF00626]